MTTPTIAVIFQQTVPLGVDPKALVTALQAYVDDYLAPAWGVHATVMQFDKPPAGAWALVFADDSDQAGDLGYHDLETQGPCGFVFVATSIKAGVPVSETASHELAELLLDAGTNLAARSPRRRWVAREVCDPVQGATLTVNGLQMADFVLPSWYGVGAAPFDAAAVCSQAWEMLPDGYVPVFDEKSGNWTPLFASTQAEDGFTKRGAFNFAAAVFLAVRS